MKIAKVTGNVVSVVKDPCFEGKKLAIVQFLNDKLEPYGPKQIVFDSAGSGAGDVVLVNSDGDAAKKMMSDPDLIADMTICGIIDFITIDGRRVYNVNAG